MSRYIDADTFKRNIETAMEKMHLIAGVKGVDIGAVIKAIDLMPTADVVEVRHGEWQYEQLDEYKFYKVTCPYCGAYYMGNYDAYHDPDDFNYCPNCGAKMDGERKEK